MNVLFRFMDGEGDELDCRIVAFDGADGFRAVEVGHREIHQNEIWAELPGLIESLLTL